MATKDRVLDKHEAQSTVWKKIEAHLKYELARLREYNDGHTLTDIQTAKIRGEIDVIKRLLLLGQEPREFTMPRHHGT